MPLRPGLFELKKWADGGPDGNLAFSSLAPDGKKVYAREVKPRASQKARWLRDSMSATGAALGSAVSSLIQQREKIVEPVPVKSGGPDDLRDAVMARNSPRQIPNDMEFLMPRAESSPEEEEEEVPRPCDGKPLTAASQAALEANRRANEIWRQLEAAPEIPRVEELSDDDDDDDDDQESAWGKVNSSRARKKIQALATLGMRKKPKAKATEVGSRAGDDPLLPEGHDLDSVASELSLNRVESEAWAQGRTLREGEDLGSHESSSLSKSEPTPRPKTVENRLAFSEDASEEQNSRARQALGAAKQKLADRVEKKPYLKRSSTSRSLKRPSQVVHRPSYHTRLLNNIANREARSGEAAATRKALEPRSAKDERRTKLMPVLDFDATDTNHKTNSKKKCHQPNAAKPLPFKVISWSSQKRGPQSTASNLEVGTVTSNTRWETNGKPEHWLLLDLQKECEVSACSFRFTGTQFDPKNVTLMRGGPDIEGLVKKVMSMHRRSSASDISPLDITLLMGGTWIVAQRCTLDFGTNRTHHKLAFSACSGRYWRLVFHESYSSTGNIRLLAPLQILGVPVPSQQGGDLSRRPSLTLLFTEAFNLGDEERETRRLARQYAVPIDYAEYVRKEFNRYDSSGTGALDYADFSKVVQTMARQKASVSRSRDEKIPESRIRKLWQNVDLDGSGFVEFGEFLLWFYHNFNSDSRYATKSFHSNKLADSATENFYASMGCNRLRFFLDAQKGMEEATARAAQAETPRVESFEPLDPARQDISARVRGKLRMKIFKNAIGRDGPMPKEESAMQPMGLTEPQGERKIEPKPSTE